MMRHSLRAAVLLCVVTLLAACVSGSESGAGVSVPSASSVPENVPPDQRAALADGKVTLAEYQGSFAEFQRCIDSGNGRLKVDERDPQTGVIKYSTGARLGTPRSPRDDSVEARCYHQYFDLIELTFMSGNPVLQQKEHTEALTNYQNETRPCLLNNGIAAPEEINVESAEFAQLIAKAAELVQVGKCPK